MSAISFFSILRYVPNIEREEFVNIGVVLHCPDTKFLKLRTAESLSRIRAFDDELDIEMFRNILEGISHEFDRENFVDKELEKCDLLNDLTNHYVNQLQFSDIRTFIIDDTDLLDMDFNTLYSTFVYYEQPKSRRVTEQQVQSILSRTFKQHNVLNHLRKKPSIKGYFEDVQLDFAFKEEFIKALSFDYGSKHLSRVSEIARNWAFIFREIKDKQKMQMDVLSDTMTTQEPKFITVVHVTKKNKHTKLALDILESESQIFYTDEVDKLANRFRKELVKEDNQLHLNLRY